MKKVFAVVLAVVAVFCFASCGKTNDDKTIRIGASPAPHAEILEECREYIEAKGFKLEIVKYDDYVTPNISLEDKSLDANYFQHKPYLDSFCQDHGYTDLVVAAKIHFEPCGIYKGDKGTTFAELKAGDKIAIPDDATNCARALQLLAANGIIKITNDNGLSTTVKDIDSNGLEIVTLPAGSISVQLPELAFAVINGNYAVEQGVSDRIVVQESTKSVAADTYANIIVCREDNKDSEKIKVLIEALQQEKIGQFITEKYDGLVLPLIAI